MKKFKTIEDPLGNIVALPSCLCNLNDVQINIEEIYDDVSMVISKPSLLIHSSDSPIQYYYFRMVGWHISILIMAQKDGAHLEARECLINPDDSLLKKLLKEGIRVDTIG